MRGLFVTAEGIDGCGKSTFAESLHKRLRKEGVRCALTAEPTDSWLGKAVRRSYTEELGPIVEAHLFMADRAAHTAEIVKLLESGKCVISDRYIDSTLAYQGAALAGQFDGGLREAVSWLMEASAMSSISPDLTFYLRIKPELAMRRLSSRGSRTRFERLGFLRGVGEAYELLARAPRFVTLDATMGKRDLVDEAAGRVLKSL